MTPPLLAGSDCNIFLKHESWNMKHAKGKLTFSLYGSLVSFIERAMYLPSDSGRIRTYSFLITHELYPPQFCYSPVGDHERIKENI